MQIYRLPKNNDIDIFNQNKNLVISSPFENHPLFSLGYHHFIDRTREAMSITQKLDSKNEFYYVVNQFEPKIVNYEDTIEQSSKLYLSIKSSDILTRDFYKLWEICFLFDVADNENMNILVLKNNEEMNAIKYYRDKFLNKINKKDKIYTSYKSDISADLIIANDMIKTDILTSKSENQYVELLINQIKMICETQNKKGNLILRIYDTYTLPTLKLIYLLTSMYNETYIYKPYLSRSSDMEKYIICNNFELKDTKKIVSNLEEILKVTKTNNFISDIFLNLELPQDFLNIFKFTNIKLVNNQQIIINNIIKYIKENNYFGDKYHEFRNQQIEASQWWITNFYPPTNNLYNTNKENLHKIFKTTVDKNKLEQTKFSEQLV
jgi:23S rRNA U2552 (ribose-2'-O)-methylase RlmE/FtsJ